MAPCADEVLIPFDPSLVSTELVGEGRRAWRVRYAGVDVSDARAAFHSLLYNRRVSLSEAVGRRVRHGIDRSQRPWRTPKQLICEDVRD